MRISGPSTRRISGASTSKFSGTVIPGFSVDLIENIRYVSGSTSEVTDKDIVFDLASSANFKTDLQLKINPVCIECESDLPTYSSSNTNIATVSTTGFVTHVSDGNCSVTVSVGEKSEILNLKFVTKNLQTNKIYNRPVSGSVRKIITDQVSNTDGDKNLFSVMDGITFTLNSECWIIAKSGFLDAYTCNAIWNSRHGRYCGACAIASDTVITAKHYNPPLQVGDTLKFRTTDGGTITKRILGSAEINVLAFPPFGDIRVLRTETLDGVIPAKILPSNYKVKLPNDLGWLPVIKDDAEGKILIDQILYYGENAYLTSPTTTSWLSKYEPSIGGDSGGAIGLYDGTNYIFLGTMFGRQFGYECYSPLIPVRDSIIAAMTTLGCTGTLTYPDWSAYTTF